MHDNKLQRKCIIGIDQKCKLLFFRPAVKFRTADSLDTADKFVQGGWITLELAVFDCGLQAFRHYNAMQELVIVLIKMIESEYRPAEYKYQQAE